MVKTLQLRFTDAGEPFIGLPNLSNLKYITPDVFPQQDDTWEGAGFFLRWRPVKKGDLSASIVMVVLAPSEGLREAFRDLLPQPAWQETLQNPLSLFVPALEYLYLEISKAIEAVITVVKHVEKVSIPSSPHKSRSQLTTSHPSTSSDAP